MSDYSGVIVWEYWLTKMEHIAQISRLDCEGLIYGRVIESIYTDLHN